MHPAVFADLRMTLKPEEFYLVQWKEDGYYICDLRVVEDAEMPGILIEVE